MTNGKKASKLEAFRWMRFKGLTLAQATHLLEADRLATHVSGPPLDSIYFDLLHQLKQARIAYDEKLVRFYAEAAELRRSDALAIFWNWRLEQDFGLTGMRLAYNMRHERLEELLDAPDAPKEILRILLRKKIHEIVRSPHGRDTPTLIKLMLACVNKGLKKELASLLRYIVKHGDAETTEYLPHCFTRTQRLAIARKMIENSERAASAFIQTHNLTELYPLHFDTELWQGQFKSLDAAFQKMKELQIPRTVSRLRKILKEVCVGNRLPASEWMLVVEELARMSRTFKRDELRAWLHRARYDELSRGNIQKAEILGQRIHEPLTIAELKHMYDVQKYSRRDLGNPEITRQLLLQRIHEEIGLSPEPSPLAQAG